MTRWTWFVALTAALGVGATAARAESFTYHGSLQDAGKAADGRYDLQLTLYSQRDGGSIVAGPVTVFGVVVTEGRFVAPVDFGTLPPSLVQGWVGVKVKAAADTAFTSLDARSPVTPEGGCPGSWALDGNVGAPASSFLDTLDSTPVWIEANNTPNAVFRPNGAVGLDTRTARTARTRSRSAITLRPTMTVRRWSAATRTAACRRRSAAIPRRTSSSSPRPAAWASTPRVRPTATHCATS